VSAFVFANGRKRGEKQASRATKTKKTKRNEKKNKKNKKSEAPPYSSHRRWTHIQPRNDSINNQIK